MTEPAAEAPTLVACLTPPGTGAIATLALRGPRAWEVVRGLFRTHSKTHPGLPANPEPGRFWLGRLEETSPVTMADEVVVAVKWPAPVPWVDLHCHGGPEVVRWLLEVFASRGVRVCPWEELERRSTADPVRAAAAAALSEVPTIRTAAILLDQFQGAFRRALDAIDSTLDSDDLAAATQVLEGLARYSRLGRRLVTPWRVAILGAPNVGKSSLVNALAGYQRSVVAPTPGTTRDVVTTLLAVDGWPVELSDTAGLRPEAGPLETEGISRAQAAAAGADLRLWVLDASSPPAWPGPSLDPVRLVLNKMDLPAAWDLDQAAGAIRVSARTGAGMAELCRCLGECLVPDPPPPGAALPFTVGLCRAVQQALDDCRAGRIDEVRQALRAIREVAE